MNTDRRILKPLSTIDFFDPYHNSADQDDGFVSVFCLNGFATSLSENEPEHGDLHAWYADGSLHLLTDLDLNDVAQLYDASGRLLAQRPLMAVPGTRVQWPLPATATGIYVLRVGGHATQIHIP